MILVKNNTARPVHVNLGIDPDAKVPTNKRVTLMPGNNPVEPADAKLLVNVGMVKKMLDEGEIVIREAKGSDGPTAAERAKALLDGEKDTRTPAQKAKDTKDAKKAAAAAPAAPPAAS